MKDICHQVAKDSDDACKNNGGMSCLLDFEDKSKKHMIIIKAEDDGTPIQSDHFDIEIKLSDVNDRPLGFALHPTEIPEGTPPGKSYYKALDMVYNHFAFREYATFYVFYYLWDVGSA